MTNNLFSPITTDSPDLLTRGQAAQYLGGISPKTLAVWESTKRYGLPIVKIGRLVRYRKSDLDAFIINRMFSSERKKG